jgi:hypothetical protein
MDKFTQAYLECALWASTDDDGEPLDSNYTIHDFAPEAVGQAIDECRHFQESNAADLAEAYQLYNVGDWTPEEQAGHDFWLTRNGHGAGFWDRGLDVLGDRLAQAAHAWGECYAYVGDDGKVYLSQ